MQRPAGQVMNPLIAFEDRPTDSPFIERVWRSRSEHGGAFQSIAACHWEMVVSRHEGRRSFTVRGPETRATIADCPADGEWIAIRFRLGTFMSRFPPGRLLDRRTVTLPEASSRSFWFQGSAWDYPDFENAESFVDRLVRAGELGIDPIVTGALAGPQPAVTPRTLERHFLRSTGVSQATIRQIERARAAEGVHAQRDPRRWSQSGRHRQLAQVRVRAGPRPRHGDRRAAQRGHLRGRHADSRGE